MNTKLATPASATATARLVDELRGSAPTRAFLKAIWRDSELQRLFFAHRETVFPHVRDGKADFHLPVLFFDTLPDDDDEREEVEQLVHAPLQLKAENEEARTVRFRPHAERIAEDLRTIGCLVAVRFMRENPPLAELVARTEDPRYSDVRKAFALQPPQVGNTFDDFSDVGRLWNGEDPQGEDPALVSLFRKSVEYARRAIKTGALEVDDGSVEMTDLAATSFDMPGKLLPLYLAGRPHLDYLLDTQGLHREEYRNVLARLYLQRLATNLFTAFICRYCHDDPLVLTTTSRISPKQQALICPKCARPLIVTGMYRLDPLLHRSIFHKDGLLGIAAMWLLEENRILKDTGAFAGDRETDCTFEAAGKLHLLECKMFRTDKDDETVEMNLRKTIGQACKTADAIISTGRNLEGIVLLTNYDTRQYRAEVANAMSRTAVERGKHTITIAAPHDFQQLIQGFKGT